jgi:hypothetical protein
VKSTELPINILVRDSPFISHPHIPIPSGPDLQSNRSTPLVTGFPDTPSLLFTVVQRALVTQTEIEEHRLAVLIVLVLFR